MELKYTENPEAILNRTFNEATANMLLFGEIGTEINAEYFIREMNYLHEIGHQIVVKINSPGGKVFDGYSIMEAIEDNNADTYIVGLAASMAGIISQSGKRRLANRRAVLMIHAPSKGQKDLINIITTSLNRELTDRSNMSTEAIQEMLTGKEDSFFDISQMIEMGLVDQVIKSGTPIEEQLIMNKSATEMYEVFNSVINAPKIDENLNQNTFNMKNILNSLELAENKTEAEVVESINAMKVAGTDAAAKIETLEAENLTLTEEVKTLKGNVEAQNQAKAEALIETAIAEGKIDEGSKDAWTEQAVSNYDLAKTSIEGIKIVKAKNVSIAGGVIEGAENTEDKTYEWLAKNDPTALKNLAKDKPEEFDKLVAAHSEKVRG